MLAWLREVAGGNVCGRLMLDSLPARVGLSNRQTRWLPRALSRLMRMVESDAKFQDECRGVFEQYVGGDFIDIGADSGTYSLFLAPKARPGARFVSFEPNRPAYLRLQYTISALSQAFPEVSFFALPQAAGNGMPARATFPMGTNYHPRVVSEDSPGEGSPTISIDSIVPTFGLKPCLIKVDVEGAEFFVLQGMKETLTAFRPIVMLEFHPLFQPDGITRIDVESLLRNCSYVPMSEPVVTEAASRQLWCSQVA